MLGLRKDDDKGRQRLKGQRKYEDYVKRSVRDGQRECGWVGIGQGQDKDANRIVGS